MRTVLELYLAGKSIDAIVTETGFGQGMVSAYLNEIQNGAAVQLIRASTKKQGLERLQAARSNGLRRASIRDFHSFRVTWITIALAAGVPLELVQRVTGHRTVEVVMKHYFRPGREEFRAAILKAMPKMLAGRPQNSPREEILTLLDSSSPRTWKADVRRLRKLVDQGARISIPPPISTDRPTAKIHVMMRMLREFRHRFSWLPCAAQWVRVCRFRHDSPPHPRKRPLSLEFDKDPLRE
jgi:hypothetical protein